MGSFPFGGLKTYETNEKAAIFWLPSQSEISILEFENNWQLAKPTFEADFKQLASKQVKNL